MTHIQDKDIVKLLTIPYTDSLSKINNEKTREIYCPYCNRYANTHLPAPKCSICKHDMISVINSIHYEDY